MELELIAWLVRRWLRHPWILTTWVLLLVLAALLPELASASMRTEPVSQQIVMLEVIFLWGLSGGLSMLGAWGEIEAHFAQRSPGRRWHIQGLLALMLLWLPAVPIFALGGGFGDRVGGASALAVLAQLTLTALLAARIPWGGARSFLFLGLAWCLPALSVGWLSSPAEWVQRLEIVREDSISSFDSPVWIAWVGSMLGLLFATLGLDLIRRPHHEVRHSR